MKDLGERSSSGVQTSSVLALVQQLEDEISAGRKPSDLAQQIAFEVRQLEVKLENTSSRADRAEEDGRVLRKALDRSVVQLRAGRLLLGSESLDVDSEDLVEMDRFLSEMAEIYKSIDSTRATAVGRILPVKILSHHHGRYLTGQPVLRAACGETVFHQEHQVTFDWDEVTCPKCLAE